MPPSADIDISESVASPSFSLLEFCRQRLEKKKKRIGGRIFGAVRQHLPPFDDAPPRLFTNPNLALICVALQ